MYKWEGVEKSIKQPKKQSATEVFSTCKLDHLTDPQKEVLLSYLKPHRVKSGRDISDIDPSPTGQIIFLVEGGIMVSLQQEGNYSMVFGIFGPGAIISDLWEESTKVLSVEIHTLEPTRMWFLTTADFEEILRKEPKLAIALLKRFERDNNLRWRHTLNRMHAY